MRRPTRLLTFVLALVVAFGLAAPAAASSWWPEWHTDAYWQHLQASRDVIEWEMVGHINQSRAEHGLRPLTAQADLRDVARGWSKTMRTEDRQYHNPHAGKQIRDWRSWGENIWGHKPGGTYVMHVGFMDSPGHRANILGDFDEVGVGYELAPETGTWWVTVNFRKRGAGRPAAAAPRPSARPERRDHGVVPVRRRLAGPDRLGTAVEISKASFDRASTAVLARADEFQDALVAGPLAGAVDGPLLLTAPDRVDDGTVAELRRLRAERVIVVGGADVDRQLTAAGFTVEHVGGRDAYTTAVKVAERVAAEQGRTAPETVWLANGQRGWPDALAAATVGASDGHPLLLVQGDRVPGVVLDALDRWAGSGPDHRLFARIAGGPVVVPEVLVARLEQAGVGTSRLGGRDRYETAAMIADRVPAPTRYMASSDVSPVWLATGTNWPDALAAAPAAARAGASLLLVDGADPYRSPVTMASLGDYLHATSEVTLLGGPVAISDPAKAALRRALR